MFADVTSLVRRFLFDRKYFWTLATLLLVGDAVLSILIIHFVRYTEIDFDTYLHQISVIKGGERDYSKVYGPTGPLVYPAGHVLIHNILSTIVNATSLRTVQYIYAALYVASQLVTYGLYYKAKVMPNWIIILLPLSKRLHSIYMLRLFNDCWASTLALTAVYAFASSKELLGTVLFSVALSIKMNILLYLPGIAVLLIKNFGLVETLSHLSVMASIQVLIGSPFIAQSSPAYINGAYNLGRAFLYKWTVNWRFFSEPVFLSPIFSWSLLAFHGTFLLVFAAFRWFRPEGGIKMVILRSLNRPNAPAGRILPTSDETITILFTSNLIGILCARSLHYQFYSWYAQQLPFLAWKTGYPIVMKFVLLAAIEWAWNVYPSTTSSSTILLTSHLLLLFGLWISPDGSRRRVTFGGTTSQEISETKDE